MITMIIITMLWLMEKRRFWSATKNDLITQENIRKIATGQGDDYATGCLLGYNYFENYMVIVIDLSKQTLDPDPKGNTSNQFYCKSRSRKKNDNVFYY